VGTYLGGSGDDAAKALAVDGAGAVYVTGGSDSPNFPVANAIQAVSGGGQDAFVAKLSPDGTALTYSTYLGGSGGSVGSNELGTGIRDASGSAYVAGVTSSTNFPTVSPFAYFRRNGTASAARLNVDGASVQYVPGESNDYPTDCRIRLGRLRSPPHVVDRLSDRRRGPGHARGRLRRIRGQANLPGNGLWSRRSGE
jgi:hypothetical protein